MLIRHRFEGGIAYVNGACKRTGVGVTGVSNRRLLYVKCDLSVLPRGSFRICLGVLPRDGPSPGPESRYEGQLRVL